LLSGFEESEFRRTPEAVTRELEAVERTYERLPALTRLPDFLSVDAALALFPEEHEREYLRERIHAQLDGRDDPVLLGTALDDEQRVFVLWVQGNLTQVLTVFRDGRLTARQVISRGTPRIAELVEEADGPRSELLVERITSMSVCCHPLSWELYRVSRLGALRRVFTFERGHVEVGPGVRWGFLNHFEFTPEGVIVSSVLTSERAPLKFVFDTGSQRFVPTAETREALARERRKPPPEASSRDQWPDL
jgi:hypothetical protein